MPGILAHPFLLLFFSALLTPPPQQQRRAELAGDAGITESKSVRRGMSAGVFRELKHQGPSAFSQGSCLVVRGSDLILLGLLS